MKKREMGRCLGGCWVGRNGWEIGDGGERNRESIGPRV